MNLSLLSGLEEVLFLAVLDTCSYEHSRLWVWCMYGTYPLYLACVYVLLGMCREGRSWVVESAHFCFSRHVRLYIDLCKLTICPEYPAYVHQN